MGETRHDLVLKDRGGMAWAYCSADHCYTVVGSRPYLRRMARTHAGATTTNAKQRRHARRVANARERRADA